MFETTTLGPVPRRSHPGSLPLASSDRGRVVAGSGGMFDGIAADYDRLNRVLSLGQDQSWRRKTVRALELLPGERVLDLASGTADLALQIVGLCPGTRVVALDPSCGMLRVAQRKVKAAGLERVVFPELGDAQELPFPAASFDAVTMAFGIRNVRDRSRALAEMARVLRPAGRVAILELSEPPGVLGLAVRLHIRWLVPRLGALLSSAPEYRYLQQSIAAFPKPAVFSDMMRDAGLEVCAVSPLSLGACHLYLARPSVSSRPGGGRPSPTARRDP